jgi:hypothetical protein
MTANEAAAAVAATFVRAVVALRPVDEVVVAAAADDANDARPYRLRRRLRLCYRKLLCSRPSPFSARLKEMGRIQAAIRLAAGG